MILCHLSRTIPAVAASLAFLLVGIGATGAADDVKADPELSRELRAKAKRGEALTPEEQAAIDRFRSSMSKTTPERMAKPAPTAGRNVTKGDDVDGERTPEKRVVFRHSEEDYPVILEEVPGSDRIQPNPILYRKPKGEGPFPVVCILPGGAGTGFDVTLEEFRDNFAKTTKTSLLDQGYMVVALYVKTYGHKGESMRTHRPFEEAALVVEYLKTLPFVDPGSIALFGGSGGGNVALGTAALNPGLLACVVAGEPASVIMTGLLEHYEERNSAEFEERMNRPGDFFSTERQAEVEALLSGIDCPVMVLHSDVHPIQHVNFEILLPTLEKLGKTVELKLYPGREHGFYWTNVEPTLFDDVDAFIRKHARTQPIPLGETGPR